MASFRIFVCEFSPGAFFVQNSRGQFFTSDGEWSFDPKLMQVFDDVQTAREDAEACHSIHCLLRTPQVFQGNLIVRLHSPGTHCRVRDVVAHLRDSLRIGLDVQNFGHGGTWRPSFMALEVDWSSFIERDVNEQLEFTFS